jgi:hypothetical protein
LAETTFAASPPARWPLAGPGGGSKWGAGARWLGHRRRLEVLAEDEVVAVVAEVLGVLVGGVRLHPGAGPSPPVVLLAGGLLERLDVLEGILQRHDQLVGVGVTLHMAGVLVVRRPGSTLPRPQARFEGRQSRAALVLDRFRHGLEHGLQARAVPIERDIPIDVAELTCGPPRSHYQKSDSDSGATSAASREGSLRNVPPER